MMKRLSALFATRKHYIECRIPQFYDPWVEHISIDSRSAEPNSLFFALPGQHFDGHDFIDIAIKAGAIGIVHEKKLSEYHNDIAYLQVDNCRQALAEISAAYYNQVQKHLKLIGVTGTDGKTTTAYFLYQFLRKEHLRCGLITTVICDDGSGIRPSPFSLSTPEAPQLFAFLAQCHANALTHVIIEASSHALSSTYSRLSMCTFEWAMLTSFSSDHLDFHPDISSYWETKLNLVHQLTPTGRLICNQSFPQLTKLHSILGGPERLLTYQLDEAQPGVAVTATTRDSTLTERYFWLDNELFTLPFGPHIYLHNALTALLAAQAILDVPLPTLAAHCRELHSVEGRFQFVSTSLPITIIVDFAHTVSAYQALFQHLHSHAQGAPLVALIGAAGERDRTKRPQLGAVAASYCQALFITDEDPRSEESEAILQEIAGGILPNSHTELFLICNRRAAIEAALRYCSPGTILVALGKGHEKRIIYHNHSIPWNESAVLIEVAQHIAEEEDGLET